MVGGDEAVEIERRENGHTLSGCRCLAIQSQGWHTHRHGVKGGRSTGLGKGVQAQIDLMVQAQIVVHVCAAMKLESHRIDAVGFELIEQALLLGIVLDARNQQMRSGHFMQQPDHRAITAGLILAMVLKRAKVSAPLCNAGRPFTAGAAVCGWNAAFAGMYTSCSVK
ncbi:MAG: hypothetical protein ACI9DC_000047 [Gammaproteobacteria bacterium]|jgi:hypothetical protein